VHRDNKALRGYGKTGGWGFADVGGSRVIIDMAPFRFLVRGKNLLGELMGVSATAEFRATRFVEAPSVRDAETIVIEAPRKNPESTVLSMASKVKTAIVFQEYSAGAARYDRGCRTLDLPSKKWLANKLSMLAWSARVGKGDSGRPEKTLASAPHRPGRSALELMPITV
jgi:hypothetical protein